MHPSRIHLLPLVLATIFIGCAPADDGTAAPAGDSSAEETEALIRNVYEAFESGDNARIDSALAENFVEHEELPGLAPNREGVKEFIGMWRSAFPDLNIDVHHVISDGDMAAAHVTFRGTHTGTEFMGVPAGGREVAVPTVDIIRFEDRRAVEHWGVTNEAVMLRQLGLMPEDDAPAAAPAADAAPADTAR